MTQNLISPELTADLTQPDPALAPLERMHDAFLSPDGHKKRPP